MGPDEPGSASYQRSHLDRPLGQGNRGPRLEGVHRRGNIVNVAVAQGGVQR
jgi:hypothetical protein